MLLAPLFVVLLTLRVRLHNNNNNNNRGSSSSSSTHLDTSAVPNSPEEAQNIDPPATCLAFLKISVRRLRSARVALAEHHGGS